ncbi:MAG: Iron complex outer membrane receptor protein, partial [Bacteroidetes bacterium]|nr:Iron complex outer membrane receptor protein [Bacteroidota bacterium]
MNSNIFGSHPGVGGALYFQDDLKLTPEWKFTLGFRADWQRVSALPSASQFSPKLGVVYVPAEETSLRFSLGAGFRYPSISELYTDVSTGVSSLAVVPNINLKPERSLSAEIGVSQWLTGSIRLECAVFQNDFDQLIEAGVDTALVIKFDNITRARIRGIETALASTWFEKSVSLDLSYTYTDPVDLDRGSVLKFRPRHLLYASVGAEAGALHFSVDGRYVSRVEAIDDRLVQLGPIINGDQRVPIRVLDTRVKYDLLDAGLPLRL